MQDSPALLDRAPLRQRITGALAGGSLDAATISEQLHEKPETIRRTLERYAGKDYMRIAHTKPVQWG